MKLSRIDYIGLNGGDGEHYDMDILERLKLQPKVNGSHTQDISDAITEIEKLRSDVKVFNKALKLTSEGKARLYYELATLKAQQAAKQAQEPVAWMVKASHGLIRACWSVKPSDEQLEFARMDGYTIIPLYTSAPAGQLGLTIPEGWQLVPIDPTNEMLNPAENEWVKGCIDPTMHVWDAMLSAAPQSPI